MKFDELMVVASTFHLKPLLPLLSKDNKFYILAVSMDEVRLLLGTKDTIDQIDLVGVPTSMQEALWMDDPEKFKGFHTSASSPGRGGERRAMFHGHGAKPAEDKTNLLRYFHYVDAGLNDMLEEKQIPMVLAGVDYLLPIYKEANSYTGLLEEGLEGNPEELSAEELHDSAWKLVKPIFDEAQKNDLSRFEQFHGQQNELASADLKTVLKAAHFGQVETLFVPVGVQKWGRYDPQENQVTLDSKNKPGNEDLLDYAAMQTIINSGKVYAIQPEKMPGDGELAAILRYAA
jgi:Bacterial archaeo-eukaryotic release factor family 7